MTDVHPPRFLLSWIPSFLVALLLVMYMIQLTLSDHYFIHSFIHVLRHASNLDALTCHIGLGQ
jgi:hypothetical protein